jgi:hypothetical protein
MMRRALIYGLLAGGGAAAWTMAEFMLGFHTTRADVGRYTGFVGLVFPVAAIILGVRQARRAKGGLSFVQGLTEGLAMTGVFAALGCLFLWLYYAAVNPGFFEQMAARGQTVTLGGQLATVLVSSLVLGLLISLLAAALLRRPHAEGSRAVSA